MFDEKIETSYRNAHMAANIFESAVVSNYFVTTDGKPIKLETASDQEVSRPSGFSTMTISYGPALKTVATFPSGNYKTDNTKVIPASYIKKK